MSTELHQYESLLESKQNEIVLAGIQKTKESDRLINEIS